MKITKIRQGLITLVLIPILLIQLMHIVSWVAAEPISNLGYTGFRYESIPTDAKSYYINHGQVLFSSHGTIDDELLIFILWLVLFVVSFLVFIGIVKYTDKYYT